MADDVEDHEPRTATVTVLFCDLVSSTERVQRTGDDEADHFRRVFFGRMEEAVAATHGEVVKNTGDGVMAVFRDSAVSAVTCAATMHDKVEALDVEPQAFVRVGVSAGEVAAEHGDYFGIPVVEAARLCASAESGQTLVSDVVRVLVGSRGGHAFRSVGALKLKGLTEPLASAALVRAPIAAPKPSTAPRSPRRVRWLYVAAAAAVIVLVAATVAVIVQHDDAAKKPAVAPAAASGYTPRLAPAACEGQFTAMSSSVVCGTLEVPQDRANPHGKWIRLEYRRYPAPRAAASGRTIVDVGDPPEPTPTGATGENDAASIDPSASAHAGADFVVMASRGMYRSTPSLECPEFDAVGPDVVSHAQGDPAVVARGQRALQACYTRLVRSGADPAHYRLSDQALDVVDLLHALKLQSVDLAGGYDGALVALQVAKLVPGVVRSLVFVNPAVPGRTFRADATASLAAVFDRYAGMCAADAKCHRAFPDLAQVYTDDYREYSTHPRLTAPYALFDVPGFRKDAPVRLDGDRVAQALAAVFEGDPEALAAIPTAAVNRTDKLNAALAAAEQYPLLLPHFPWGGYLSRICNDQWTSASFTSPASQVARPEFAGYDDRAFVWMCGAWPVPRVQNTDATIPALSAIAVPTFVARMDLAPRQSFDALDDIRAAIPSARVFELHAPTPGGVMNSFPPCFGDLVKEFEGNPAGRLDTAACERLEARIPFVVPAG